MFESFIVYKCIIWQIILTASYILQLLEMYAKLQLQIYVKY